VAKDKANAVAPGLRYRSTERTDQSAPHKTKSCATGHAHKSQLNWYVSDNGRTAILPVGEESVNRSLHPLSRSCNGKQWRSGKAPTRLGMRSVIWRHAAAGQRSGWPVLKHLPTARVPVWSRRRSQDQPDGPYHSAGRASQVSLGLPRGAFESFWCWAASGWPVHSSTASLLVRLRTTVRLYSRSSSEWCSCLSAATRSQRQ